MESIDLVSFLLVHFKCCPCVTSAFGGERHELKLFKCHGHAHNCHHLRPEDGLKSQICIPCTSNQNLWTSRCHWS